MKEYVDVITDFDEEIKNLQLRASRYNDSMRNHFSSDCYYSYEIYRRECECIKAKLSANGDYLFLRCGAVLRIVYGRDVDGSEYNTLHPLSRSIPEGLDDNILSWITHPSFYIHDTWD